MSGKPDPSVDTTEDTSSDVTRNLVVGESQSGFVLEFSRVTPDLDAL